MLPIRTSRNRSANQFYVLGMTRAELADQVQADLRAARKAKLRVMGRKSRRQEPLKVVSSEPSRFLCFRSKNRTLDQFRRGLLRSVNYSKQYRRELFDEASTLVDLNRVSLYQWLETKHLRFAPEGHLVRFTDTPEENETIRREHYKTIRENLVKELMRHFNLHVLPNYNFEKSERKHSTSAIFQLLMSLKKRKSNSAGVCSVYAAESVAKHRLRHSQRESSGPCLRKFVFVPYDERITYIRYMSLLMRRLQTLGVRRQGMIIDRGLDFVDDYQRPTRIVRQRMRQSHRYIGPRVLRVRRFGLLWTIYETRNERRLRRCKDRLVGIEENPGPKRQKRTQQHAENVTVDVHVTSDPLPEVPMQLTACVEQLYSTLHVLKSSVRFPLIDTTRQALEWYSRDSGGYDVIRREDMVESMNEFDDQEFRHGDQDTQAITNREIMELGCCAVYSYVAETFSWFAKSVESYFEVDRNVYVRVGFSTSMKVLKYIGAHTHHCCQFVGRTVFGLFLSMADATIIRLLFVDHPRTMSGQIFYKNIVDVQFKFCDITVEDTAFLLEFMHVLSNTEASTWRTPDLNQEDTDKLYRAKKLLDRIMRDRRSHLKNDAMHDVPLLATTTRRRYCVKVCPYRPFTGYIQGLRIDRACRNRLCYGIWDVSPATTFKSRCWFDYVAVIENIAPCLQDRETLFNAVVTTQRKANVTSVSNVSFDDDSCLTTSHDLIQATYARQIAEIPRGNSHIR